MKIKFDPRADVDKLMTMMEEHEVRSQVPGYYYDRWIDATPHWQFVDDYLKNMDWISLDTRFPEDIEEMILEAADGEEFYEDLEYIAYATELDDAINAYLMHYVKPN